ncbi:MAG TPA: alpha/beta fold hydrolase [Nitrososphaera sp.]|jgi:pimeloyl-ACP methyl ester carboxylesterase|nr:alpha/beta fold hydrolase [Nitrososphaera sp.]
MFSSSILSNHTFNNYSTSVLAQPFIQTVKHRDLVIDLGNGIQTNAQLTIPAVGNGPFPGVLLVAGSGAIDMNETLSPDSKPFWQIAQYLSERGFAVLRYDKRGVGANSQIIDTNIWGNLTFDDLKNDAEIALGVLTQQPEVDPTKITLIGHSEGTIIAPRIVIDQENKTNATTIKNVVLMGSAATTMADLAHYQKVGIVLEYMHQVLDKNGTGSISVEEAIQDPLVGRFVVANFVNDTTTEFIDIDRQVKPLLEKELEEFTKADVNTRCDNPEGCPIWFNSAVNLEPNLSVIGNLSKSTSILMLNGENDPLTPVQQSFLLEQRLTEVDHPDHILITYPSLGHTFAISPQWSTGLGPIEQYVLSDLHSWLSHRTHGLLEVLSYNDR